MADNTRTKAYGRYVHGMPMTVEVGQHQEPGPRRRPRRAETRTV